MKQKLFSMFVILYIFSAVSCNDDDTSWTITNVEVKNINNEKDVPFASNDSIRKEAYALDILYIGKLTGENVNYSRIDFVNCNDTIIDQRIISVYDFDDTLPAGTDVTKYFKPIYGNLADTGNKFYGGTFVLTRIPLPGLHSFSVYLHTANGTVIENSTQPIILY